MLTKVAKARLCNSAFSPVTVSPSQFHEREEWSGGGRWEVGGGGEMEGAAREGDYCCPFHQHVFALFLNRIVLGDKYCSLN